MSENLLFGVIGGLGLFLFGMKFFSEGLQKAAGQKLRQILKLLTNKPVIGVITGAIVTATIQSSSATTVMVVGFVNAGLLLLRQAIGVVMGANIGTTMTAQIIAFKIDQYALPAIGIGFAIWMCARRKVWKAWGQALLGFGVLFLGLAIMKQVLGPLKDSEAARSFLMYFSKSPLLAVFTGFLLTAIIQSSSATIGLVMALAFSGLIDFNASIGLILGADIGTTVTAWIASIGTNVSARRVAASHTIFNVIGVCYMLYFVYNGMYARFIDFITPGVISQATIMRHVANAHTMFKVIDVCVFLPMIGILERFVIWLIPGEADELHAEPKYLERHLLNTPPLALDQAKNEIIRMMQIARQAVTNAMNGFFKRDLKLLKSVAQKEEVIDNLQKEITQYLIELSERSLTHEESEKLPAFCHSVNDVERIGDHAENLVELAERAIDENLPFSETAIAELKGMFSEVDDMLIEVMEALDNSHKAKAYDALKREEVLNNLQIELRENHIQRLNDRICYIPSGIIFLDMVNNLEKIGDHLTNIAQAVIGSFQLDDIKKQKEKKSIPSPAYSTLDRKL